MLLSKSLCTATTALAVVHDNDGAALRRSNSSETSNANVSKENVGSTKLLIMHFYQKRYTVFPLFAISQNLANNKPERHYKIIIQTKVWL